MNQNIVSVDDVQRLRMVYTNSDEHSPNHIFYLKDDGRWGFTHPNENDIETEELEYYQQPEYYRWFRCSGVSGILVAEFKSKKRV